MLATIFASPVFVGLAVAFPSTALGYLGYRHSRHVDAIAEQAGIATVESGTVGQVIDGLNKMVANLQVDNEVLRKGLDELGKKLAAVVAQCEKLKQEMSELRSRCNSPDSR